MVEAVAVLLSQQILVNLIGQEQVMAVQEVEVLTTSGDGHQLILSTLAMETLQQCLLPKPLFRDTAEQWALVLMALTVVAEAVVAEVAQVALGTLGLLDHMVGTTRLMSITHSEQAVMVA
tara:strand:+ start:152 stop:511 length:360 start_codon:yes stop_codon:yes gene_type:complete